MKRQASWPQDLERPVWIPRRAGLVLERRDEQSVVGQVRVGSRPLARLLWSADGEMGHMQQLDTRGQKHGLEIERDSGSLVWCAHWVHGKQHGLAIRFDEQGVPLLASEFVRGRGTDLWTNCGEVTEVREYLDGQLHGYVWWGNPEQPWLEERFQRSERHGTFRQWDARKLSKGFPQFYVKDVRVSRRAYQAARAGDPSLPPYVRGDDANRRPLPSVVREAVERAQQLRRDHALIKRVQSLAAVERDWLVGPASRESLSR